MNRPGAVPQSIRGIPAGFGQQQPQQPTRTVSSSRLQNGKIANNSSGWAFGGGVPMGNVGLQNQSRQMGGGVSFAQSLSGSSSATPLDLSEFPSLSNTSQLPNTNQGSMWSSGGSRNISGPVQRNQPTPLSSQAGQDDFFGAASSRISSAQNSFRYGNQGNMPPPQSQSNTVDDFPPLNRSRNGEIGSERLGLASQNGTRTGPPSAGPIQPNRGNGLLNVLSANNRVNDVRSPAGLSRSQDSDGPTIEKPPGFREDTTEKVVAGEGSRGSDNEVYTPKSPPDKDSQAPEPVDPLDGMAPADKYGLKGLRTLMNTYPDFHATVVGIDPNTLGLGDLSTSEPISKQIYSLFDDTPPRPTVSGRRYRLPDCYNVTNVQPIETKIVGFNEETLFWIFYSCPNDVKQHLAASELHSRNWRWHKRHHIWLTKDEQMTPQILSPTHERGYYIVWDTLNWCKDRREFTLYYTDLDTTLSQQPPVVG